MFCLVFKGVKNQLYGGLLFEADTLYKGLENVELSTLCGRNPEATKR